MHRSRAMGAGDGRLPRREGGFTLVELLVVLAVVGALAVIAVPVYLGIWNSSKDAAVRADLVNAKGALVGFGAAHEGAVPSVVTKVGVATWASGQDDLARYGWSLGSTTSDLVFSRSVSGAWCVLGTGATGATYVVTSSTGVTRAASCPGGD